MRIKKHEKSYIVELEDGSARRIWPGDLAIPALDTIDPSCGCRNRRQALHARPRRSFARDMRPRHRSSVGMDSRKD